MILALIILKKRVLDAGRSKKMTKGSLTAFISVVTLKKA